MRDSKTGLALQRIPKQKIETHLAEIRQVSYLPELLLGLFIINFFQGCLTTLNTCFVIYFRKKFFIGTGTTVFTLI